MHASYIIRYQEISVPRAEDRLCRDVTDGEPFTGVGAPNNSDEGVADKNVLATEQR